MDRFTEIDGLYEQAEGWWRFKHFTQGKHGMIIEEQRDRASTLQTFVKDFEWDDDIIMMTCGLSTDMFDLLIQTYDPRPGADGRIHGRTISYIKSLMKADDLEAAKQKKRADCWWTDKDARKIKPAKGDKRGRGSARSPIPTERQTSSSSGGDSTRPFTRPRIALK